MILAVTEIYRTPEHKARDKIDAMLNQAGWKVQSRNKLVDRKGGMGQMYKLFGDRMDDVIDELNKALAA